MVHKMTFLKPVRVGDKVSLYAKAPSTGLTSMRIAIEAWRPERDAKGKSPAVPV